MALSRDHFSGGSALTDGRLVDHLNKFDSGTFTPTFAIMGGDVVFGPGQVTMDPWFWTRVGNVVNVRGAFYVGVNDETIFQIRIGGLPVRTLGQKGQGIILPWGLQSIGQIYVQGSILVGFYPVGQPPYDLIMIASTSGPSADPFAEGRNDVLYVDFSYLVE